MLPINYYSQDLSKTNTPENQAGYNEGILTLLSGLGSQVPAGLAGLLGLALAQDPEKAADIVNNVQESLTYIPRTKQGMQSIEALASAGEAADAPFKYLADKTFDATDSPLASTAAYTASQFLPLGLLGKAIPKGGKGYSIGSIGGQANKQRGAIAGFTDSMGNPVNTDDIVAGNIAKPNRGEIIQTRRKGEVVDIPTMYRKSDAGYIASPTVHGVQTGKYGSDVSQSKATGLLKEYANAGRRQKAMLDARHKGGQVEYVDDLYATANDYEGLLGKNLIFLPADKTSVAKVTRIGGVDLKTPITTEGGPLHADKWKDWASMYDAASGKQLHANKVAEETGDMPTYMYVNMDHEGSNFSTMASEGVLRYLESAGDLTNEGKRALDKAMRKLPDVKDTAGIAKYWPKYESWEQILNWLTDKNIEKGSPSLGNRRKAFMNVISNKEFQKYGAPDVEDVYAAINEQALRDYPAGYSGLRAAESVYADPKNLEYRPDGHGSYDTRIPLENVQAIQDPMIPWEVMFPEMYKARQGKQGPYRSAQTAGSKTDYQPANEQWLMGILDYLTKQQGQP